MELDKPIVIILYPISKIVSLLDWNSLEKKGLIIYN